jgi:four helix bundle protein
MGISIRSHRELKVYQAAMAGAKAIFLLSLRFPSHEQFGATDQIRRCSRSVPTSVGEAWRKRRYKAHWVSKLSDAEQEAAETQVWLEIVRDCGYITDETFEELFDVYEHVLAQLTIMATKPEKWLTPYRSR